MVAMIGIVEAAKAFDDPAIVEPSPTNELEIAAGISPTANQYTHSTLPNSNYYVHGSYSQDSDQTHYTFWLPKAYAGRPFVVLASGTAVLNDVQSPDTALSVKQRACAFDSDLLNVFRLSTSQHLRCEAIYGTIPTRERIKGDGECGYMNSSLAKYVSVEISGTSKTVTRPDWAHQVTNLPGLAPQGLVPDYLTSWNGIQLSGIFMTGIQTACKDLTISSSWETVYTTSEPWSATTDSMIWTGAEPNAGGTVEAFTANGNSSPMALQTKSRSADRLGNILLAVSTTCGAISIGFMPVAYEAWRRRARYRRLRPA
jgi:hypothetical protein